MLRLSGPRSVEIAAGMFHLGEDTPIGFHRYRGTLRWGDEPLGLPAELYVFRAPRSFTRQDLVEIHTLGSVPLLTALLEEAFAQGARPAEPGEFTGRAYLAGAMDLTAVEGVAAMIHAGSDGQLRAAEQLLHGTLARETKRFHSQIVDLLALVEASIDFVDEPIEFVSADQAGQAIGAIVADLEDLLRRGLPMERLDARSRAVLFGPPNAGKSTLFNRLTGLDRSICSPEPGTTRDVIAAPIRLPDGREIWLADCAGVGHHASGLDADAADATRQAAEGAGFLLLVLDGTKMLGAQTVSQPLPSNPARMVVVINKCDLLSGQDRASVIAAATKLGAPIIGASAATGEGCGDLVARLAELFQSERMEESSASIVLNARHRGALRDALAACQRADALIRTQSRMADAAELVALELRDAATELGAIVGEVTTDEMLSRIFSRFCIGK